MTEHADKLRPSAEEVRAFLHDRPDFLAENPDLYRRLVPPVRVHGETLADHMEARIRATQRDAQTMASERRRLLAAGRIASGLAQRVQAAVLALIEAASVGECVDAEFPALLGVDAAALCSEHRSARFRLLPSGTVERVLAGKTVALRRRPLDAALLHAEAAPLAVTDALIRIPLADRPALLALACRDGGLLDPASVGPLAFLGRAVGAALVR